MAIWSAQETPFRIYWFALASQNEPFGVPKLKLLIQLKKILGNLSAICFEYIHLLKLPAACLLLLASV